MLMPRTDENVEKLAQMLYSVWEMYVWGCLFQCYLFFFLLWLNGKEFACYNAEDVDLIPGWGRSPGVGNGNLLQHSCLENSMDSRAWQATVHGVTESQTRLSDWALGMMDREAWHATVHGIAKNWTRLSDWTEVNWATKHICTIS